MKNGLLLGAGFSYELGMPLAVELTEVFLNVFTDDIVERMAKAMSFRQPYGKDRPIEPSYQGRLGLASRVQEEWRQKL